ncbi:MAG: hypothetical protein ACRDH8_13260 [Actinomycetota bacterium]
MTDADVIGLLLFVDALVFSVAAALVRQGRGGYFLSGFLWGLLLGPIGLLVVAIVKPPAYRPGHMRRECPHCRESIKLEATVCPHCQREIEGDISEELFGKLE